MKKLRKLLSVFLIMLKVGLFTFGGGYAMIAIIENELVDKRKFLSKEEFLDMVGIAESTPGPIAINSATYIGYKSCGVLGAIFATVGVVLPSFVIIYAISLFFDAFLENQYVAFAFSGIKVAVSYLIVSAGIKLLKEIKKSIFSVVLFILFFIAFVSIELLSVSFSTVFLILIGGATGVFVYLFKLIKEKVDSENKNNGGKE